MKEWGPPHWGGEILADAAVNATPLVAETITETKHLNENEDLIDKPSEDKVEVQANKKKRVGRWKTWKTMHQGEKTKWFLDEIQFHPGPGDIIP